MANPRKANKVKKLKQSAAKYAPTNPEMAKRILNKAAVLEKTK